MTERVHKIITDHAHDGAVLRKAFFADHAAQVAEVARAMALCLTAGGKILFCGNGGSAADAQHLAAELSGRFYFDRPPLNAEALHVNTSFLTAAANDYSFEQAYERLVQAFGREGDVLLAFSTSGNSPNIVRAIKAANELGMTTIGFSGAGGGSLAGLCDILFRVPSTDTPRIQEVHILLGHILCEQVEAILFKP